MSDPLNIRSAGALPVAVAHRGYSAVAPENTLAAVVAALRVQSEYVEIDTHVTADGVPVVLHDASVDRTTDGTGRVAELTAEYVTGLDAGSWFAPACAGQHVPTLGQVLDQVRSSGSTLLLEVKPGQTQDQVRAILDEVRSRDMAEQILLQSFDEQVLRYAEGRESALRRGLLRSVLDDDPVQAAKAFDVVAYNPSVHALLQRPDVVGRLNEAGVAVIPYTIDDPDRWTVLADLGVDGIITNRVGEYQGWRRAVGG